jgi:hypothetical protein
MTVSIRPKGLSEERTVLTDVRVPMRHWWWWEEKKSLKHQSLPVSLYMRAPFESRPTISSGHTNQASIESSFSKASIISSQYVGVEMPLERMY